MRILLRVLARLAELWLIHLVQGFLQFVARIGEVLQQLHFVIEVNQESLVFVGAQNVVEERLTGVAFVGDHGALAAAGVHEQTQRERQVGIARKIGDGLGAAVFIDDEVVLAQGRDQRALLVAHRSDHVDDLDLDGDRRLRRLGWRLLLGLLLPGGHDDASQQDQAEEQRDLT